MINKNFKRNALIFAITHCYFMTSISMSPRSLAALRFELTKIINQNVTQNDSLTAIGKNLMDKNFQMQLYSKINTLKKVDKSIAMQLEKMLTNKIHEVENLHDITQAPITAIHSETQHQIIKPSQVIGTVQVAQLSENPKKTEDLLISKQQMLEEQVKDELAKRPNIINFEFINNHLQEIMNNLPALANSNTEAFKKSETNYLNFLNDFQNSIIESYKFYIDGLKLHVNKLTAATISDEKIWSEAESELNALIKLQSCPSVHAYISSLNGQKELEGAKKIVNQLNNDMTKLFSSTEKLLKKTKSEDLGTMYQNTINHWLNNYVMLFIHSYLISDYDAEHLIKKLNDKLHGAEKFLQAKKSSEEMIGEDN